MRPKVLWRRLSRNLGKKPGAEGLHIRLVLPRGSDGNHVTLPQWQLTF